MNLGKNIFLVNDDINDRALFIEVFKEINNYFKYTVAYNDKDAWNKLKVLKHLPDLIFIDVNTSEMNEFEFLNRIKGDRNYSNIPVIVLSESGEIAEKVYKSGAEGFILKPFLSGELQSEIEYVFCLMKEIILTPE